MHKYYTGLGTRAMAGNDLNQRFPFRHNVAIAYNRRYPDNVVPKESPMCMLLALLLALSGIAAAGGTEIFRDDFNGMLAEGWSWVRENPAAWRVTEDGLEIRVEPGNLWGKANNARNVLVRSLPEGDDGALSIALTVTNAPTNQYEQVNLVWYYDDRHMVKIGLERVDGVNSLVMGREEADKTTTLAIIPVTSATLDLRITARGTRLQGEFREAPEQDWRPAGACVLPAKGPAKASIQAYQGPPDAERWAKITGFRIERSE